MSMNLDRDYTVNGYTFKAGDNVDTTADVPQDDGKTKKVDFADAIKEMQENAQKQDEFNQNHHGAVEPVVDRNEVTEQTPTRPLADGPDASEEKKAK